MATNSLTIDARPDEVWAVLADARCDFSRAVREIGKAIVPAETAAAAKNGGGRWFGKAA